MALRLDQSFIDAWLPRVVSVLRIVTSFLFLQHATAKLFHVPYVSMFDAVRPLSFLGAVGILELVLGLLTLVGLYTRAAAFILSGEMAFAYFIGHVPQGHVLTPMLNGGEPAVLYCFIFLTLSVAGGGTIAMDNTGSRRPLVRG